MRVHWALLSWGREHGGQNWDGMDRPGYIPRRLFSDPADRVAWIAAGHADDIAKLCGPAMRRAQRTERKFIE
jgi:hypothetical protein